MKFWCENPALAAEKCKQMFPMRTAQSIKQAEAVCCNSFLFSDHWEMERTHEPVQFEGEIDWTCIPSGDPEWLYAMNRHTSILNLSKAWLYTGEKKYAQKAVSLLENWIERVKCTPESRGNTWRSLEAGLRCENWLRSLKMLEGSEYLTEEFLHKMTVSLEEHASYLRETSTNFQRLSNWGVLQDHGLFLAGLYLGKEDYVSLAVKRLDRELHMEIMRDGSQWEQSPMYHCEVLHCALDTVLIAQKNEIILPPRFVNNVRSMCNALSAWVKPNGRLYCQSDSDDTDARDLLAQGAILFQDAGLKAAADGLLFEENIWDFSGIIQESYEALKAENTGKTGKVLPDSGNYMLRGDETGEAAYLHMHCGCLGSGHGHADLLHIDVGILGEDILIDSGRYTYVNTPLRRELKSPAAHNTTRVDGKDFSVCADSWGYERLAVPIKGEYTLTETVDYISGFHMGYFFLEDSVLTERKVIFIKPDIFLIFDRFYAKGMHSYEQNFHFNKGKLQSEGNGTYNWQGEKASARLIPLTEGLKYSVEETPYSRDYNLLEIGDKLTYTKEGRGCQSMIAVLAAGRGGEIPKVSAAILPVTLAEGGKLLSPSQAQAAEVIREGRKYTVIVVFDEIISEVNFFRAGDCEGYGKIMVFSPDNPEGNVLAW